MNPAAAASIVELLRWRAVDQPDRIAYIFLGDGEVETARLTYADADRRARAIATYLQQHGAAGERVLIAYPAEATDAYVTAFLGCLYARALAVPCDAAQGGASAERLAWVAADAQPRFVLQPTGAPTVPGISGLDVLDVPDALAEDWRDLGCDPDDVALLQYTSGSTRGPRGVMVSHANIVANERAIEAACRHDAESRFVGWLPLFHDMGMIANVLQPVYLGSSAVLMPPSAFLAQPLRWLRAIDRYRGVTAGGPNFGYDLCASRIRPDHIVGLDLSSWRVAFNGAEVVRSASLRRFMETFAPAGFAPETFFPCYGLAEATLIVAGGRRGISPRSVTVDAAALAARRLVVASAGSPRRELVSSGPAVINTRVAIVDPESRRELPPDVFGEVWVAGPGVASGYWRQPAESEATFGARLADDASARFLRTGDLGAWHDGELYLAGRIKDLIIIRGQNHFPEDLEWTVERSHPALRPSCGAAFSIDPDGDVGDERLVIVYELAAKNQPIDIEEIAATVRAAVSERHHLHVHAVAVVQRGGVAKTTSGKVRRGACRDAYLSGDLPLVGVSIKPDPNRSPQNLEFPDLGAIPVDARPGALARALVAAICDRTGGAAGLIGVDTPLSGIGLDSISATEIQHRLQERYGVELAPLSLLNDRTARQFAAEMLSQPARADPAPEPSRPVPTEGPLTATQRALWFEYELAPPGPAYTLVRVLRLVGPLDVAALDRAVVAVVHRHASLRTRFTSRDGQPWQVVTDGADVVLRHEDLPGEATAVDARLAAEAARPFNLLHEPPVRLTLLRRGPEEHLLVLAAHHLVADLWSLVIIVRELLDNYRNAARPSPPLRTTVIEQALREVAPGVLADEAPRQAYWQDRLAGAPPVLHLPLDRPRPSQRGFAGAAHPVDVSRDLTTRLRRIAHEQSTTLLTVILTAYQLLLSRHAAQRDVVVGVLSNGRDRAELADVVGCLVNPVPVRLAIDSDESFRSLVARHRIDVRADLAHAYPFARLVSLLDPHRVPGAPVLIQAMLVFQQEHGDRDDGLRALALGIGGRLSGDDPTVESAPIRQPWTHLDLTLNLAEIDGALTGTFEYDAVLFDPATVATAAARFQLLLEKIAVAPDSPIWTLSMLTEAELDAARAAARGPRVVRPTDPNLARVILNLARRRQDAIAVVAPEPDHDTIHVSYHGLRRWAGALAVRLADAGVGPESPVGVLLERSPALPAALLAVLARGAVYLPLDPDDPPHRLAWLIRDAGVRTVVTTARLAARLPEGTCTLIEALPPEADVAPAVPPATHPEQSAYVIYTSGSTGTPKGVAVPVRGVVNRLLWMQEEFALSSTDRVVHKTPTTFDVSVWELCWPLMQGACLVLAPPGAHRDPPALARLLAQEQVTTAHFVPSVLAAFLAGMNPGELPALTRLVCSGEVLPSPLADRAMQVLPAARLFNLYGPTEASIDVTSWECQPGRTATVPIGAPIANTDVYVLDSRLVPLPDGVSGEIYLGGMALARGYVRRPALTAATFVPDPLSGAEGARIYRTGDRGRRRDRALEYLGRGDQQVKISGNRIELGEVEAVLRSMPAVGDAAAVVADGPGGPRLVAYLVPQSAATPPDPEAVRMWVMGRLPTAYVPARLVVVPSLPVTGNGKLDRAALARLPLPEASPRVVTEPVDNRQQWIAQCWANVLGVGTVGADEGFFALGGDSILAVRLVAELREAGVSATVADLLAGATVRSLADRASDPDANRLPEFSDPAPFSLCPPGEHPGLPNGLTDAYPVSHTQRAVLFHQLHDPSHEVYVTGVRVRAGFDAAALSAAADAVLQRHPYLRSSFDLGRYQEPLQLVHDLMPTPLTIVDLRDRPADLREMELENWLRDERKRPLDVTQGPLVRFSVHRLATDEFHLSVSSFALDGWCTATVLTEVLLDVHARSRGAPAPIAPPRIGYASFVRLELEALASAPEREFWAAELDDLPSCLIPRSGPGRAAEAADLLTRRVSTAVDPEVTASLARLARRLGVSLRTVLLAAHLRVVRLLTGQSTVVTGVEVNGRPEGPDGDRVVGVFNNIVPLRVSVPHGSWIDLVNAAAAAERRVFPHRRYPLAQLEREHRVQERFNTLFVFTHFHVYRQLASLHGLEVLGGDAPDTTYVPLTAHFNLDAQTDVLRVLLDYDPVEISDEHAGAVLGYYTRALAFIASDPDRPAEGWPLLSPGELAAGRMVGPPPAAVGGLVHEMILRQAERSPDTIAVADAGHQLTYRALAARSGRLATSLRRAGAGPDTLVALPARCDAETVVALVAVLRAGGGYLPVDSLQPAGWLDSVRRRLPPNAILDAPELALADRPLTARVHPANLAYALLTSGSTGEPKLVGVSHGAVANYLRWCAEAYGPAPGSRTPVHSSLGFDLTVTALLAPLVVGGTVDLSPAGAGLEALGEALSAGADGLLKITPAHLAAVGQALRARGARCAVARVVVGGEQLRRRHIEPWADLVSAGSVVNEYGPTEATVGCCTYVVRPDPAEEPVPVGLPIPGTTVAILDDGGTVPSGVVGELYIGGVGLARGYLGQPGATAARFVPDRQAPGDRLYRTGDHAARMNDGRGLVFHGRRDRQLKIRGYRVEPAVIERELEQHPDVSEAAVAARSATTGDVRLVAYWVPRSGQAAHQPELARWLTERLPPYLVPEAFIPIPTLPMTSRGKVDYRALPDPAADRRERLLQLAEHLSDETALELLGRSTT